MHRSRTTPEPRGSAPIKILLSLAAAGLAAAMAGLGTYATFTDSVQATTDDVEAGTVDIALGGGGYVNRLTVGATGIVPGDTIQRAVDLRIIGSQVGSVTLTREAIYSSLLDTDTTNGLQLTVQRCSEAWAESGGPAYTYTCAGSTSTVLASLPVIGAGPGVTQSSPASLSNLGLTPESTIHLRLTLTFPADADNSFQAARSTFEYTFAATQRTPTGK